MRIKHLGNISFKKSTASWLWLVLPGLVAILPVIVASPSVQASDTWPSLAIQAIPLSDGQEIAVWADLINSAEIPVSGTICYLPAEECQLMTCLTYRCHAIVAGLPTMTTIEGELSISMILASGDNLISEPLTFVRAFVPASGD